jgi:beta-lactamase regulating signal transducer with metallopeptidase domain
MIALAMCYAVVISLPLAGLGLLAEHLSALGRRPRRWGWAKALAAVVILTALTPWRAASDDPRARPAGTEGVEPGRPIRIEAPAAADTQSAWLIWRARLDAQLDAALRTVALADASCRWVWPLGSAGVLLAYVLGRAVLARRRRTWRETLIQSERVLVAAEDGPAIVGVLRPRIVVPEWALALEPGAVRLMLSHEREHLRARDPLLIHLGGIALLLMPWNPLIWWMVARLRLAVELDCDARVLGMTAGRVPACASDVSAYGELLLTVVTRRSSARPLVAPAMLEHPSTLARRISAMYSHRARLIGLRVAAAGSAALVLLTLTLILPVPPLSAQSPSSAVSKETAGPAASRLAGAGTAPAFRAPAPGDVRTLVGQYGSDASGSQKPITLVLVLDSAGNVIGTQSTQVLEMLIRNTRQLSAYVDDNQRADARAEEQARARRERERQERERAEVREPERVEPMRESRNEAQAEMSREDEARAKRARAEQEAAELLARLISIDVVRYAAGEIAPAPVNVFFITTSGSVKTIR